MPIIPVHADPVAAAYFKRQVEKAIALQQLRGFETKLTLKRDLFFVPGWAGEDGQCWMEPYDGVLKGHAAMRWWMERLVPSTDQKRLHFLTFSREESQPRASFLEFAGLLKQKIHDAVASSKPVDLVCHSMGSLDAMAAITQPPTPLQQVVNVVAVGSPLQGIFYGELVKPIDHLLPFLQWEPHHYIQVRNLNAESAPMRLINSLDTRQRLLTRVSAFYTVEGTQDAVVMRSARLRTDGLSPTLQRKVTHRTIDGATHTGPAGVTQDPRTARDIVSIVAGLL